MSKFRTTSISDPKFERDNLRYITVKTPNLKGRGDICVFVPEGSSVIDLPMVILLHGVYGSCWAWSMRAGAHLTAQRLINENKIKPMILVMPSDGLWGDGSAYLPHNSFDFEKWIVEDVSNVVIELITQASDNSPRFISGLSMGGFGALRIGSKYPQEFKGISGHSSITSLEQMNLFVEEPLDNYTQDLSTDEDVFLTMSKNSDQLPQLRFDCGKDDLLIEHNRRLHQQLLAAKIQHSYHEFEGAHEWEYWEEHLKDTLLFFDKLI
ncbi:MAG: putative tributyrin esterase [Cyclobacteriaceae bacterium]